MKHVIAYEGVWTTDGRVIEQGALTWPQEIPLYDSFDGQICGTIDSIEREGGEVTGHIRLHVPTSSEPLGYPCVTVTDAQAKTHEGLVFVVSGKMISVFLGEKCAWSQMERI